MKHGFKHGCGPFGWGGPFGHRRRGGRMFDAGALRLMVLGLIAEAPRHGYDIIRALSDQFQGAYSPSPGSIYPMLQMMEEAGLLRAEERAGKRLFAVTESGLDYLGEHAAELARIRDQVEKASAGFGEQAIGETITRFRASLLQKVRGGLDADKLRELTAILDRARSEIDKL